DASQRIADDFEDHRGEDHLATGRDALIKLSSELSRAFTVRGWTRSFGPNHALSFVRFRREADDAGTAVWLCRVQNRKVVARWIYGEGAVAGGWRDEVSAVWQDLRHARAAIIVATLFAFAILWEQSLEIIRIGGSDASYSVLNDSYIWMLFLFG